MVIQSSSGCTGGIPALEIPKNCCDEGAQPPRGGREGWGYSGSEGGQPIWARGPCCGWWETSVQPASAEAIDSVLRVAQLESPECFSRPKAVFVLCSENVS